MNERSFFLFYNLSPVCQEEWAKAANTAGLLPPCGTDVPNGKPLFCPNDLVDRAWAAYMIVKAKNLPLPP